MPAAETDKLKPVHYCKDEHHANAYRGFAPFLNNDISHKEFFDMGIDYDKVSLEEQKMPLHEYSVWPKEPAEECKEFKKFMMSYYDLMLEVGIELMSHFAEGIGLDKDYFKDWFDHDSISTFRLIHYNTRDVSGVQSDLLDEGELKLVTPHHSDSGILTILSIFDYKGLQVEVEGKYYNIDPIPDTLVINLGDTFSRLTNYKLPATKHRVIDIGGERHSVPFFLEPRYLA